MPRAKPENSRDNPAAYRARARALRQLGAGLRPESIKAAEKQAMELERLADAMEKDLPTD